jgi:membrane fusion protein, multidrug efflux system
MVQVGDPLVEIDPGPNQAALTKPKDNLSAIRTARRREARFGALPGSVREQCDSQTAIGHAGRNRSSIRRHGETGSRASWTTPKCSSPTATSPRRFLAASVCGWWTGATSFKRGSTNPLVVITELQPISVIFNVAEDDLPQIQKQLRQGKKLSVDAFDRAQTKKIATGTFGNVGQPN